MHGVIRKSSTIGTTAPRPTRAVLILLVVMTGLAPVALYMLVPALPVLATAFGRDISIAQMTVSLYMVGLAASQIIMGPLSDRYGRRPVLLAGFGLMVIASLAASFAETLPQLIVARFFQALGGASGMVIARAIIRDLYPRERVGAMISLVVAALMIGQLLSPLAGGLLEHNLGWRTIFYAVTIGAVATFASLAALLPETRRRIETTTDSGFVPDARRLLGHRAFVGYMLCMVLASSIIFVFAGAGPFVVVTQMHRSSVEYGAWFATSGAAYLIGNLCCARFAPRFRLNQLVWFGLAMQLAGAVLNVIWGVTGLNQVPSWLFITHMVIMFGNAFVMANSSAGAISIYPNAAGTASGMMGFLQMGFGSLCSQFGAWLGGHFATPLPLNIALLVLSAACAACMVFIVPRSNVMMTEELIEEVEEEDIGLL